MSHAAATPEGKGRPTSRTQLHTLPEAPPQVVIREDRYVIRFAQTADEMHAALRLRYEVFNLELGEGLESSHVLGRDEDRFDAGCHHLLVQDERSGAIVGTYRMQTREMALANGGFYSDGEFDLAGLGPDVIADSVEVGRACVALEHRKQRVLFGLWKGLAAYMLHSRRRYLFGCCSLTSQDPHDGRGVYEKLQADGLVHPTIDVAPRPGVVCPDPDRSPIDLSAIKLPTLFGTYMRFGALVCSQPAIDREFRTIDFLVLMDTATLPERVRQTFFGS